MVFLEYIRPVRKSTDLSSFYCHSGTRARAAKNAASVLLNDTSSQTFSDKTNLRLHPPDERPLVGCADTDCSLSEAPLHLCENLLEKMSG